MARNVVRETGKFHGSGGCTVLVVVRNLGQAGVASWFEKRSCQCGLVIIINASLIMALYTGGCGTPHL